MKQITEQNATFMGWEPAWANACVGENGNPQIYEYASGYASATKILLEQVISDHGISLYVDTFIYPICFNMRHAVELFLKSTAVSLEQLAKIRSSDIPGFDLAGSHDLGNIWSYVKTNALQFDSRYIEIINRLDQYVIDISKIDATGQVFRYPFDLDNKKHLTSVSTINILILKERWIKMEQLLNSLNRLNDNLLTEYGWGGFTKKLSRVQLAQIAAALPSRDQWSTSEFDKAKLAISSQYSLSSNDFSKALNVIQGRRELAALCGHVPAIPDLEAATLVRFFDIWLKKHDLKKTIAPPPTTTFDPGIDYSPPHFDEILSHHNNSINLAKEIVETVKPAEFAALHALFYFDREDRFSEIFEKFLNEDIKKSEIYPNNPAEYLDDARHLLEKTGAFKSIINSLNFLGQTDLVNTVVDHYKIRDHIGKLLESSNLARAHLLQGHFYV